MPDVAREVDSRALLGGEVEGVAPPRPFCHGLAQHQPLVWLPLPLQGIVTCGVVYYDNYYYAVAVPVTHNISPSTKEN